MFIVWYVLLYDEQLSVQKLENSTLKIEAGKAIKAASTAMLNTLVDSIFEFVDQPMLPYEVYISTLRMQNKKFY